MIRRSVADFLDQVQVPDDVMTHDRAFTAQGVAARLRVSGRELAKATNSEAIRRRYRDYKRRAYPIVGRRSKAHWRLPGVSCSPRLCGC